MIWVAKRASALWWIVFQILRVLTAVIGTTYLILDIGNLRYWVPGRSSVHTFTVHWSWEAWDPSNTWMSCWAAVAVRDLLFVRLASASTKPRPTDLSSISNQVVYLYINDETEPHARSHCLLITAHNIRLRRSYGTVRVRPRNERASPQ